MALVAKTVKEPELKEPIKLLLPVSAVLLDVKHVPEPDAQLVIKDIYFLEVYVILKSHQIFASKEEQAQSATPKVTVKNASKALDW